MAERSPQYAEHDVFHRGDRLRKARELAGYPDLKAFAAATGIDRGALGRYETTGDIPRKSTLKQLVLATGVREEWLDLGRGTMYNTPGPDGVPSESEGKITDRYIASPAGNVRHIDFTRKRAA